MSYATPAELAGALNIMVTEANESALDACLDAAATEIDHHLAADTYVFDVDPGLLNRVNINRAIEWWKAPDAYNGNVGIEETGVLVTPASGFDRHAALLLPYKASWGLA